MKDVTEIHYFKCTCSKCGDIVENKNGVKGLKENGWLELEDDILCPNCIEYYKSVKHDIGDRVVSLIQDDSRQIVKGKAYTVCDSATLHPTSTYVDVGNGWQARLDLGEYDSI